MKVILITCVAVRHGAGTGQSRPARPDRASFITPVPSRCPARASIKQLSRPGSRPGGILCPGVPSRDEKMRKYDCNSKNESNLLILYKF